MLISIPQSDRHGLVKVVLNSPKGELEVMTDGSQPQLDVSLPSGVKEDDVSVIAYFCIASGDIDLSLAPTVIKEKVAKAKPEVKAKPVKSEDKAEEVEASAKVESVANTTVATYEDHLA